MPVDADIWSALRHTDLDLIDQLLRDRIPPGSRILDAGAGEGRNLLYFLHCGYPIWAIDQDEMAVRYMKYLFRSRHADFDTERIIQEKIESMLFPANFFDVVFCINVLHSADSSQHLQKKIKALQRVVRPSGLIMVKVRSSFLKMLSTSTYFHIEEPIRHSQVDNMEPYSFVVLKKQEDG